ncbi:hypothetical protein Q8A73_015275 [Channa argus]|nr:hypothetical protein Q8A73_015275 [Channa argus]
MKVPAGVAAVSCLCPLVVFLCVVSQSCYGTQVNLRPHTNPNPSLYPNLRLKSMPVPTPNFRTSSDKDMTLEPSQVSSSSQNFWVKPRLVTMSYITDNQRSDAISNYSGATDVSTYYNASPASLSSPKSLSKQRPSSQTNTNARPNSKTPNRDSRTPIRAQSNQTKLLDIEKDSQHRPKRGWIWNQFFVLEEHIGPEPQYVGKKMPHFVLIALSIATERLKCRPGTRFQNP